MRTHRAAFWIATAVALAAWASARAATVEELKGGADLAFSAAGFQRRPWRPHPLPRRPPPPPGDGRLFEKPGLSPVHPSSLGPLIGGFLMSDRLDAHRSLLNRQLGPLAWDLSVASDPRFDTKYATFARPDALVIDRLVDLNRLRGEGVVVKIDPRTSYRLKVSINIFSPVRGSTLKIEPEGATRGPSHQVKTGAILDAAKAKSFVFSAGGNEYWLLYGTDVDPATDRLADTRTLLFVHENGLSSKAWPLAESALTDQPLGVDLGGAKIALVRTAEGRLEIHSLR